LISSRDLNEERWILTGFNREKIEKTMEMAIRAGTIEKKCDLDAFISLDFK